jgi:hypothetical protein
VQNGFLVVIFSWMVCALFAMNPAEWVKFLGVRLSRALKLFRTETPDSAVANHFIDVYMILKWTIVSLLLIYDVSAEWAGLAVAYLLFFNLFGYFYYHAWGAGHEPKHSEERDRRRFVNFLQAIAFSVFGFAYLYLHHSSNHFTWPHGVSFAEAVTLSAANSFTLSLDPFAATDTIGKWISLSQVLNVFFFFVIFVANSVPAVGERRS